MMSRSEMMPATSPFSLTTTMAPIRFCASLLITSPRRASGRTVATARPFVFKICAMFMPFLPWRLQR
jgi:hypothetical protein